MPVEQPQIPLQEPPQEPQIEEKPETDALFYTISKYAGDYFFPPVVSEESGMFTMGSAISREQFFSEVRTYFSHIPWTDRRSRAREIARAQPPPYTPDGQAIPFNEPPSQFMEAIEQTLIAKFRPEARTSSVYRTKREAERKEGQKREFTPQVMTKDQLLKDIEDKIGSVQWRAKNPNHAAKVGSRPGIRQMHQKEIDEGDY